MNPYETADLPSLAAGSAESIAALFSGETGRDSAETYMRSEGLLELIDSTQPRFPPEPPDLARLHATVRARKVFTVLEFGLGYSTIVMADALEKNRRDWEALTQKPALRKATPFTLYAVDSSQKWIERAQRIIPPHLQNLIKFHFSGVRAGMFQDRACHYYESLPDVVPDFIYLDGPDPAHVRGDISGLTWQCPDRVVMAADILRMEPELLPGTVIVIDGRTANARFLLGHLYRHWITDWNIEGDVTVLELREQPLGSVNMAALEYCLGKVPEETREKDQVQ